jgi:hypothetical protein
MLLRNINETTGNEAEPAISQEGPRPLRWKHPVRQRISSEKWANALSPPDPTLHEESFEAYSRFLPQKIRPLAKFPVPPEWHSAHSPIFQATIWLRLLTPPHGDPQVIIFPPEEQVSRTTFGVSRLRRENAAVSAFTWGAVTAVAGSWLFAAPLWAGFVVGFLAIALVLSLAFATEPQ